MNKPTMKGLLAKICIFAALFLYSESAFSASYFVAPSGGSNTSSGLSQEKPWSTFKHALSKLKAGDTLYLLDGVYHETLDVNISGTANAPITIRALHDGKAIIDGQGTRSAVKVSGSKKKEVRNVILSGFVAANSNSHVFQIRYARDLWLNRLSGNSAVNLKKNTHVFSFNHCKDILVEDCAAYGTGRILYDYYGSERGTFRRCWGRWKANDYTNVRTALTCYGSGDCLVENCVMTMEPSVKHRVEGIKVNRRDGNSLASRNRLYGNIAYGFKTSSSPGFIIQGNEIIDGTECINNVSIENTVGFHQRNDRDLTIDKMTIAGCSDKGFSQVPYCKNKPAIECGWGVGADIRNSSIVKSGTAISRNESPFRLPSKCSSKSRHATLSHASNNLHANKKAYAGTKKDASELSTNPGYQTGVYGKGAYLMVPEQLMGRGEEGSDIGAEVLYRYHNGELTDEPLWPWPMEERILSETGVSVTYENKGGLWKTLPAELA